MDAGRSGTVRQVQEFQLIRLIDSVMDVWVDRGLGYHCPFLPLTIRWDESDRVDLPGCWTELDWAGLG
ncbi:hypothetical protein POX_e07199 [Penicillium oxalicum]|uniref:hypothetical protein n=1 Tax=Penicillium oxalicum TaxID=69781 RepID=UPI0020B81428|nr:hypothetical protein POX_e07199 [Penicillium oxalicum]KAI2789171.1 hypothetical protein POX_e07199 [Penicillium oxalicum]